jgi:hypothetical protein
MKNKTYTILSNVKIYKMISNVIGIMFAIGLGYISFKMDILGLKIYNFLYAITLSLLYIYILIGMKKDIIFFSWINKLISRFLLKVIFLRIVNDALFKFDVINNRLCLSGKPVIIKLNDINYKIKIYDDGLNMFDDYLYIGRFSYIVIMALLVPIIEDFKINANPAKSIIAKMSNK